jgi:hypothetical protein
MREQLEAVRAVLPAWVVRLASVVVSVQTAPLARRASTAVWDPTVKPMAVTLALGGRVLVAAQA